MSTIEFKGKGFVYSHHLTLPFLSLLPAEKKSVGEKLQDGNLIVEGNGLLALKALIPRFGGRIDLIYAMPPYNNGIDGWHYDDDVPTPLTHEWLRTADRINGRDDPDRHDKWLSWMLPRLRLMHELLSESGVLFVSIDDNEMHRLKCLLDEIFQEDNFLATFVWQKRYSPPPDVKDIGHMTESILAYRKSRLFERHLLPLTEEQLSRYKNPNNDSRGPWKAMDYTCRFSKTERPNLYYPIRQPTTDESILPKVTRVWAFSESEHKRNERENRIWWGSDGKNRVPALKNFANEIQQGMVPTDLLLYEDVGHTDEAAKELRDILPGIKRDAKPTRLIRHLMRMGCGTDGLVLFPFAGVGEGPQAVLEANAHEVNGGKSINRRFIAIGQTDADTVVAERARRLVANGLVGQFEFCKLGPAVDAESLLTGDDLPPFDAIAGYVFRTATGRSLNAVSNPGETWLIGQTETTDVHLIYRPDNEFLKSDAAILNESLAEKIAATRAPGRSSIVFSSGKYVPQRDLAALGIEFCPFPIAVYRILGAGRAA